MDVEVLYFQGCPNFKPTIANIRIAEREEGITIHLTQVEVNTPEEAMRPRFLGSPSVRVNGLDLEPDARQAIGFGLGCRSYRNAEAPSGTPSVGLIRQALVEAVQKLRKLP